MAARPSLPKILNVAEKNDAAKELAKVMSGRRGFQRREGFSKFNKIYEFNLHILGREHQMVMTSVSGHLMQLDFIQIYRNWQNCAPIKLFDAQVEKSVQPDFIPIKRTIQREIRGCQDVILWTDGDREGEDIAQEIVDVCFEVRQRLRIHRARFSEITPQSITRACTNLTVLDKRMVDAVEARQELDLRIGCAFTRFQTMRLRKVFPNILSDQLVSYGPCQFPTLGFVVDRYKEIQAFVPETFYKITVTHQASNENVSFNWKRVRLFNHTCCLILYQLCMENPTARVVDIKSKPKSKWRPCPLDTVELEKLCSRKLRISAKETMKIAEKLYTQGFISYPRTETNIFPESFDLVSLIREQTQDHRWGGFAGNVLSVGPTPRNGQKTDNAHPPIHPVKYTNSLTGNEQRLYEFVVRHFLACCSKNAEGNETTVEIEIGGERFIAKGLVITARNYLDVYIYDKWADKTLPQYQLNGTFLPSAIEMIEGETNPPSLLQEADLIALMDKHGIGTDATHAEHIETIKTRSYVGVQSDGSFVPGELGIGLVEGYDSMGYQLSKPKLRAELEDKLKRICDGYCTKDDVVREMLDKYKRVFVQAKQQARKLDLSLSKYFGEARDFNEQEQTQEPLLSDAVRRCPFCKEKDMVVKRKKDGGYMLSCLGFPHCRSLQFFPSSVIEAKPHPTQRCNNCYPPPVSYLSFKFQRGSTPHFMSDEYTGCSTCDGNLINVLNFRPIKEGTAPTQSQTSTRGRGSTRGSSTHSRGRGFNHTNNFGPPPPPPPPPGGGGAYNIGRGAGPSYTGVGMIGGGVGGVVCNCGIEAILLTVRNEQSINKGRQFYKCAKRDEEGKCNFFLWADESDSNNQQSTSYHTQQQQPFFNRIGGGGRGSFPGGSAPGFLFTKRGGGRGRWGGGGGSNAGTCRCGLPAVQRTVQSGNNQGRLFRTCPKPRDEQCGFFEWMDNPGPSGMGSSAGGKSRGRTFSSRGGDDDEQGAKKKRAGPTCSICHTLGHTKRTCPNNN
ncbi:PREDICTED: DNA topoisomerase 3-alpha-like isoform X3 [Amphimedon queenslandica]|uniref:DNA topoisomerase n=1 Tax=Amphimedon queenslandica TaxID=400682 RepID=A0AAN0J640_AMPQE|nr:PREDICTED: DNA topoisomerase 3-alpha-like isoform X3 [Amphimedon queenslandica]|eukprot:XP_019852489.1 PREDICTED: DNA topoisomerase 3-alpha-like isoform X3 [Amphimedon queenslandica]